MEQPLVSVCCLVYNHAPYLRQCLDGFVMQQTNFPFEVLIHDDVSTDNSRDIIKEYIDKYPDIFIPIFQTENQYSKGEGILIKYVFPKARGKYIALCEGDDYWTDPLKLQKQADIMEQNNVISMCCSSCYVITNDVIDCQRRYLSECIVPVPDIIVGGGLWLHTATYVFRKSLLDLYPDFCRQCHVGDFPLVLWAALNGGVYYFPEAMAAYRFQLTCSWTDRQKSLGATQLIQGWKTEVKMLEGLDQWCEGRYAYFFRERIKFYLYDQMLLHKNIITEIASSFKKEIGQFTWKQKMHILFIRIHAESLYTFLLNGWHFLKKTRSSIPFSSQQ